jgi:hypothetical protein
MSEQRIAKIVVEGYTHRILASDWTVLDGILTIRRDGDVVAQYSRWTFVAWMDAFVSKDLEQVA